MREVNASLHLSHENSPTTIGVNRALPLCLLIEAAQSVKTKPLFKMLWE